MSKDRTGARLAFPIGALLCAVTAAATTACSSAKKERVSAEKTAATAASTPTAPTAATAGATQPAAPSPQASAPTAVPTASPATPPASNDELRAEIDTLKKLLAEARSKIDELMNVKKPTVTPALAPSANARGGVPEAAQDPTDPEFGFISDSAVQSYRQAMILYQTRKYPEAVLAFSAFLERYGDHTLAGSAQFYSGEAYYRQKEFKLAWQEYLRVTSTYGHSPHISHALARLIEIATVQGLDREASDFRQKLSSLFPSSPAQAWLKNTPAQPSAPAPPMPSTGSAGAIDLPAEKQTTPVETAPLPAEGSR